MKLTSAPPRWLFFAIFTISGFSGLIYESIWSHYLKLFLGHAAYAQSLVLMIFMGGLALGSWLTARFSEKVRRPILVYALVEGVIGVIALVFHDVFISVSDTFYFSILPSLEAPVLAGFLKWTAAAALIVPQSVLLGMTFPLMSTGIVRRFPDQPGGSLAMLYFTNSIGAAVGVLASGFWLIGAVGLPGTMITAGLLNLALALTVWVLVKLDPLPVAAPRPTAEIRTAGPDPLAVLFFVAAGVTGAASFIYEIGWIRMLGLVLGATTHSFELMLSAFITGLALGGLWIKRRIDRIEDSVRFAGWVQIVMGVMAVLTIPLYVQTFDWMSWLLSALQRNNAGYGMFTAFSHGIALLVMVPTTFLAGMTLPLFTHVLMRSRRGERAIGQVYAANTLGSIVGVLFAVHIGLPILGLKSLIVFGAALDVLLGLVLLYRSGAGREVGALAKGALVGAGALALISVLVDLDPKRLASGVYRYAWAELGENWEILYYEDGKTATISLGRQGGEVMIATNGKPDASLQMVPGAPPAADEVTMIMAGALPLAYKPDAKRIANIGLGSGLTTHTLLADAAIEHVDTVEIEAAMVRAARGYGDRVARTYSDPRSEIHLEDAKTFFSLQNRAYDIIIAEPSNPWVSGVASLFSEEFYRTVPNYLTQDGILVQWLQLYEFNDRLALSVLAALSQHFSDFAIYNTDSVDILIVAKRSGELGRPDFDRVLQGALGRELSAVGLNTAADLAVRNTGSKRLFDALLARSGVPANSDYFPFLDLNAGRARFRNQTTTMFIDWGVATLPLLEMIGMEPFDYADVTSTPTYERTQRIAEARKMFEVLVLGADDGAFANPELHLARSLSRSCGSGATDDARLGSLHSIAAQTLPFLRPDDAVLLADAALPPQCLEQSSARVRTWFELYRAIAARDAERMATAGFAASGDEASDADRRQYALGAAMLGSLQSGHPDRSIELWEKRPAPVREAAPSRDVEVIVEIAHRRSQQTAAR